MSGSARSFLKPSKSDPSVGGGLSFGDAGDVLVIFAVDDPERPIKN